MLITAPMVKSVLKAPLLKHYVQLIIVTVLNRQLWRSPVLLENKECTQMATGIVFSAKLATTALSVLKLNVQQAITAKLEV